MFKAVIPIKTGQAAGQVTRQAGGEATVEVQKVVRALEGEILKRRI